MGWIKSFSIDLPSRIGDFRYRAFRCRHQFLNKLPVRPLVFPLLLSFCPEISGCGSGGAIRCHRVKALHNIVNAKPLMDHRRSLLPGFQQRAAPALHSIPSHI